jgi:hypothetical protein
MKKEAIVASPLLCSLLFGIGWATLIAANVSAATVLKQEPTPGSIRCGQVVFVDDKTCPKGQIKKLTGGCNRIGPTTPVPGTGRLKACVPISAAR